MAAANTDKLRKTTSLFSTTLSSSVDDSTATIPLNSTSGLPTDTAVTLTIDRVDSDGVATGRLERVTGVVSGSNLTTTLRGRDTTTAQTHPSGAVVECIISADQVNDQVDAILAEHNQDGTHNAPEIQTGWIGAGETWAYASWDSDTRIGTITVPSDATTKYSAGMRIRISQSTGGTKYGIIHKVEATTLTVFFEDGATLENETITSPAYSTQKAPFGFPIGEETWSIIDLEDGASDGATNSWTNPTNYQRNVHVGIGVYDISLSGNVRARNTANDSPVGGQVALSFANDSVTDNDLLFSLMGYGVGGTGDSAGVTSGFFVGKRVDITSSSTLYAIGRRLNVGESQFRYNVHGTSRLQITSAYV
jgi:hypothetical protein